MKSQASLKSEKRREQEYQHIMTRINQIEAQCEDCSKSLSILKNQEPKYYKQLKSQIDSLNEVDKDTITNYMKMVEGISKKQYQVEQLLLNMEQQITLMKTHKGNF